MKTRPTGANEPLIDGAFIDNDLGIAERRRRNYLAMGLLPPPDANLLGKNLWRVSTYRKFKVELLAGKFAKLRRAPSVRALVANGMQPSRRSDGLRTADRKRGA